MISNNGKTQKVYYWSPFISRVATVRAVIRSAESLKKYSKNAYEPYIINSVGEWFEYESELKDKNIKLINFSKSNLIKNKQYQGYINSRLLYWYIFFKTFFPLLNLIKKNPPRFLIIHLMTSLPLLLNLLKKFNTHIILRISGFPKLNLFRKQLWKITLKKVFLVTTPTVGTLEYINSLKMIKKEKVKLLRDPVISCKEVRLKKKEENELNKNDFKNYFISIGRLTKQKNFLFLIDCFSDLIKRKKNYKLVIIGEGEHRLEIEKKIYSNNLKNNIILLGYKENIFKYLKDARAFLLTSLWEDPGFVLVESAYCNIPIISSDCKNGPEEFLNYGKGGMLFKSNSKISFLSKIQEFENINKSLLEQFLLNSKQTSRNFTIFHHFKTLFELLNYENNN